MNTTIQQIFFEKSSDVQRVLNGGELSEQLFSTLFDYFCASGEMPYGTATAVDGDPYEWIKNRVHAIAEDVVVYDRPEFTITYLHAQGGNARYRQYIWAMIPPWAVDVQAGRAHG